MCPLVAMQNEYGGEATNDRPVNDFACGSLQGWERRLNQWQLTKPKWNRMSECGLYSLSLSFLCIIHFHTHTHTPLSNDVWHAPRVQH